MKPSLEFISQHIKDMPAYEPILPYEVLSEELGLPAEELIKLDANENPLGSTSKKSFNRYPDPYQKNLKRFLEKVKNDIFISKKQNHQEIVFCLFAGFYYLPYQKLKLSIDVSQPDGVLNKRWMIVDDLWMRSGEHGRLRG